MHGFLDILTVVGQDPMSWGVVAILAASTAISLIRYYRCPVARLKITQSPEEAEALLEKKVRHPLSFAVVMIIGITMAIVGLFGLANPESAHPLKFLMLVAGLFVVLTWPLRYSIRDSEARVIASRTQEQRLLMQDGLLAVHRQLLSYEFGIIGVIVLTLVVF